MRPRNSPEPFLYRLAGKFRFFGLRPQNDARASILIITLWSLCLLATFAVILGYSVRQKLTLVKRLDERDRLRFMAEAGILRAVAKLQEEDSTAYDALNEEWSTNNEIFENVKISGGTFSIYYPYFDDKLGAVVYRYGLMDEESKININTADAQTLKRLFEEVLGYDEVLSQELAASIIDWRDADSMLSIPLGSAEDPYYRNLSEPYEAKDGPFEVIEELLLVKGIDAAIFEKLKPYITIYGEGRVNVNTASETVLLSCGLRKDIVEKIITYRNGADKTEATGDDNVFEGAAQVAGRLSEVFDLNENDLDRVTSIADQYLTGASAYFTIHSVGRVENHTLTAETTAVADRSGNIVYWRESL